MIMFFLSLHIVLSGSFSQIYVSLLMSDPTTHQPRFMSCRFKRLVQGKVVFARKVFGLFFGLIERFPFLQLSHPV